ncbi:hypothetical protein MNBD_DELTA03-145, partial [hydrothermal vent metagenome]
NSARISSKKAIVPLSMIKVSPVKDIIQALLSLFSATEGTVYPLTDVFKENFCKIFFSNADCKGEGESFVFSDGVFGDKLLHWLMITAEFFFQDYFQLELQVPT